MEKRERAKEVLKWLMYIKNVSSQKEMANLLGYSQTILSSALTGKLPMSDKLVKRICEMDDRINLDWVMNNEGEMLHTEKNQNNESSSICNDTTVANEAISNLVQTLASENKRMEKEIQKNLENLREAKELIKILLRNGGKQAINAALDSNYLHLAASTIAEIASENKKAKTEALEVAIF